MKQEFENNLSVIKLKINDIVAMSQLIVPVRGRKSIAVILNQITKEVSVIEHILVQETDLSIQDSVDYIEYLINFRVNPELEQLSTFILEKGPNFPGYPDWVLTKIFGHCDI